MGGARAKVIFRLCEFPLVGALVIACAGFMEFIEVNPDAKTGLFPTDVTVPDSAILEYRPTDISRISVVYVSAAIGGGGYTGFPERQARQREFMVAHVRKMGSWRVTDDLREAAAACGDEDAESMAALASRDCSFLHVEIDEMQVGDGQYLYAMKTAKYPEGGRMLYVQGRKWMWTLADNDVHRPLLNVLKRWHDDSISLGRLNK